MPDPRLPIEFKKAGEFTTFALIATVVGKCPCGSSVPVTLPVIPGAGAASGCDQCGTIWFVEKISYVELRPRSAEENPGPPTISIGVRGVRKTIVAPPPNMPNLRG